MSERALKLADSIVSAANVTTCDGYYEVDTDTAAAIISQALAAERKARDAEICAWLRALTPEQMGWQYFGEFDEDARTALADAIERGDV